MSHVCQCEGQTDLPCGPVVSCVRAITRVMPPGPRGPRRLVDSRSGLLALYSTSPPASGRFAMSPIMSVADPRHSDMMT